MFGPKYKLTPEQEDIVAAMAKHFSANKESFVQDMFELGISYIVAYRSSNLDLAVEVMKKHEDNSPQTKKVFDLIYTIYLAGAE